MTQPDTAEAAPQPPAFNLLDSAWVPVRFLDGHTEELGLLAVFDQAAQIEGLAETAPPNLVAIYRLLLAITHRALTMKLRRWTDRDRAQWYAQGLPGDAVADYLTHWRDRFWLFHPEHPFMQVAALATADETRDRLKPWTQVALQSANGNTPVVFDHAIDGTPEAMAPAAVLRQMLGFLQFTPGGLVQVLRGSDKGGPLANTAAVLPIGENLLHTLLLALHPAAEAGNLDLPSWERPAVAVAHLLAEPKPATGCCDRYTRISRAVQLLPVLVGPLPTVRWLRFGAGVALTEDDNAPDSMATYRPGSAGLVRMSFTEGRAMWRDLGALLPDTTGALARPAEVLSWATNLHDARGDWDSDVPVLLAGMCSAKAKLIRWRQERHRLPRSSLCQADISAALRSELGRCEEIFDQLRTHAAALITCAMPDGKSKDTKARARAMLDASPFAATFFASAERQLPALLQRIASADLSAAHLLWSATLLQAAQSAWAAARGMLGSSASALRADAMTHGKFLRVIQPLRPAATSNAQPTEEAIL